MVLFINLTIFILGASIGSFLNVLIDRLSKDESINGRSHCDHCKKKIAWYDLIPVLSFFILGGKTRCCGKKLSFQYPLIEIITGIIFLLIYYEFSGLTSYLNLIILFGLASSLLVIFVSDLKYHLISDYILLALFVFSLPAVALAEEGPFLSVLINHLISGLIVSFPIFLIYFISKERAMGLGDVYLSAIMGFLLGWKAGFMALYIAFVTGAIFGLVAIIFKNKKLKSKIAFGPFLVLGIISVLFYQKELFEIVRKILGY